MKYAAALTMLVAVVAGPVSAQGTAALDKELAGMLAGLAAKEKDPVRQFEMYKTANDMDAMACDGIQSDANLAEGLAQLRAGQTGGPAPMVAGTSQAMACVSAAKTTIRERLKPLLANYSAKPAAEAALKEHYVATIAYLDSMFAAVGDSRIVYKARVSQAKGKMLEAAARATLEIDLAR